MFGYIAPDQSVLTEAQRRRYRSFYCGVCHSLRDRHGQAGRLSLSHDMTFLAILLSSLYEPDHGFSFSRCAFHPLKAHGFCSSPLVDYAADMNALLFHYKCVDQRMDDRSILGKAGEILFRKKADKVSRLRPVQTAAVGKALAELWEEERRPSPNPDRLCNLSGAMLGAVFVPMPEDPWSGVLRSVGESLGRFVYWMDAWEDQDDDLKKHRFNPLSAYRGREDYEDFCRDTLELLIAEAADNFEILPLENDLDLLRNILYYGVWLRYMMKNKSANGKEDGHAE